MYVSLCLILDIVLLKMIVDDRSTDFILAAAAADRGADMASAIASACEIMMERRTRDDLNHPLTGGGRLGYGQVHQYHKHINGRRGEDCLQGQGQKAVQARGPGE